MGRSDTKARAIVSISMDIYSFLTATGVKNIWTLKRRLSTKVRLQKGICEMLPMGLIVNI